MSNEISFYCIRVINKDGTRGWVFDSPSGIKILVDGIHSDITQFETEQEALNFIRDKKIERNGIKAYIRTNLELIETIKKIGEKGASVSDMPLFYLENHKGEKCFYDSKREVYFFKEMGDAGYPIWQDEEKLKLFVKLMEFEQGAIFIIKVLGKGKKEKKLIQVYGQHEKPDGTLGDPKYVDIEEDEYKPYSQ